MNMNTEDMIERIAEKDFDVDEFVHLAIWDGKAREEIVFQMITNPDIMVYYHCYYVISKASRKKPDLFDQYWGQIAGLLSHKNSYHRNFCLDIIGNLTMVDHEGRFSDARTTQESDREKSIFYGSYFRRKALNLTSEGLSLILSDRK